VDADEIRAPTATADGALRVLLRWSELGIAARARRDVGDVQEKGAYQRRHQRQQREAVEAAGEAAGRVLHEADPPRPEEAAEIAERVDPGDAGGERRAAQEHRRHGEERSLRAIEAHGGE